MKHDDVVKAAVKYDIISLDNNGKYVANQFNTKNFMRFIRHLSAYDGGLYDYLFVAISDDDCDVGGFIVTTDEEWENYVIRAKKVIAQILDDTAIERPEELGYGCFLGEFNFHIGNSTETIHDTGDYEILFEVAYINEETYKFFVEIFGTEPVGVFPLVTSYRN